MSKIQDKLDKYRDRLTRGKAHKIKPKHVEKVIGKLAAKEADLLDELKSVTKPDKRDRINSKIATIRHRTEQAKWLLNQI